MGNDSNQKESRRYLKLIGSNIRKLRQKEGLTQEKLALKAGLDRSYIGGIERGERNISVLNLKKCADALKIDIILFFKK